MIYKNLLVEQQKNILIIKINRPDKLNVLNGETLDELQKCFNEAKHDTSIDVVILTGAGEKAFAAGADISEISKLDVISAKSFCEKGQDVFNLIEKLSKPVIAAVNGFALGGGCELAMACHIRLASDKAIFAQPEVNLGIIPGFGGTQRLTRLVNSSRAIELILTGDMINAEEAYRIGLVNKIIKAEKLLESTIQLAETIGTKAQAAVRLALKAIVSANELPLSEGQNLEAGLFAVCCGTKDFKEGTTAFLEKRKPEFNKQ